MTAEKELLKDGVSIGGDIRDRRCNGGVWDWVICAAVGEFATIVMVLFYCVVTQENAKMRFEGTNILSSSISSWL